MLRRGVHLFGKALRETGQAIDRLGLTIAENEIFNETYTRHRTLMNLYDKRPIVAADVFVAPNASVIGQVLLLGESSVWYGAVIRGDKNKVQIGFQSNVQDRAVIDCITSSDSGFPSDVSIGSYVTIGHGALLKSCIVGDEVLIGQGAIIQEGSVIQSKSVIAAGAVVQPGTLIPSGQLWAGNPAVFVRELSEDEQLYFKKSAETYSNLREEHKNEFLPFGTAYQAAEKLKA